MRHDDEFIEVYFGKRPMKIFKESAEYFGIAAGDEITDNTTIWQIMDYNCQLMRMKCEPHVNVN